MSNKRRAPKRRSSNDRQPLATVPAGAHQPGRRAHTILPPANLHRIREVAGERARATGKFGITNEVAVMALELADHIDRYLPWTSAGIACEVRRRDRRARWQRRPSAHGPGLAWADRHRAEILAHWHAQLAEAPFIDAQLWIIPHPGRPRVAYERVNCPQCTVNGRGRGCKECAFRGTVIRPKETTR